MTFPRKIGLALLLAAIAASLGHWQVKGLESLDHLKGLKLPTLAWFYHFDPIEFHFKAWTWSWKDGGSPLLKFPGFDRTLSSEVIGHLWCGLMAFVAAVLLIRGGGFEWNPTTQRRFARFRSIGRGLWAFRILMLLLILCLLDQVLVGKRALAVKYNGHWYFPAFVDQQYNASQFGGDGDQETDYRDLQVSFLKEDKGNRVILPMIPWDPVLDSQSVQKRELVRKDDGRLYRLNQNEPYQGQAVQYFRDKPDTLYRKATFRHGFQEGNCQIYNEDGGYLGNETWHENQLQESKVAAEATSKEGTGWTEEVFNPAPPSFRGPSAPNWAHAHYLGTDPKGWDVAAILFGGMQQAFFTSFVFVIITYAVGILLGTLMGYFGGWFDLFMQRIQEVLSNMPLLLVIMVVVAQIGPADVKLKHILGIYCAFSWISVTVYMRSSTYREKARDHVAAARVQGAGTLRVIFHHILPNVLSTLVTLLPFTIAGLITSITALDFLGFGLPESYPSWGRLLEAGTSNLNSPWIVSSVFVMLVFILLLITFVGEAIREAFDPKKFTTYK